MHVRTGGDRRLSTPSPNMEPTIATSSCEAELYAQFAEELVDRTWCTSCTRERIPWWRHLDKAPGSGQVSSACCKDWCSASMDEEESKTDQDTDDPDRRPDPLKGACHLLQQQDRVRADRGAYALSGHLRLHGRGEECTFPKGTDKTYLKKKLEANMSKHPHSGSLTTKVNNDPSEFLIKHYVGDVTYSVIDMLERTATRSSRTSRVWCRAASRSTSAGSSFFGTNAMIEWYVSPIQQQTDVRFKFVL